MAHLLQEMKSEKTVKFDKMEIKCHLLSLTRGKHRISSNTLINTVKELIRSMSYSFYELLTITELPNNELTSIHTRDLPPLLL